MATIRLSYLGLSYGEKIVRYHIQPHATIFVRKNAGIFIPNYDCVFVMMTLCLCYLCKCQALLKFGEYFSFRQQMLVPISMNIRQVLIGEDSFLHPILSINKSNPINLILSHFL